MRVVLTGLLLTALLLTGAVCGAEQVTLPADTPVFAAPDHQAKILFVVRQELTVKKTGDFMQLVKVHPLAMYFNFSRLEFPNGAKGYWNPEAFIEVRSPSDYSVGVRSGELSLVRRIGGILPWLGLLFLLAEFFQRRRDERSYEKNEVLWRLALVPVLLRQGLLLAVVNGGVNIIAAPADDIGYFSNALGFLRGDFSQPWHFTVGQSILYLPFIWLTGATDVKDIMVPFSWFCGLVLAPATLAVGFLIGVKLTSRRIAPLAAMLLWAVLPFFYHHQPDFVSDIFRSFWDVPSLRMTFQHYTNLIGTGFNAMSDTPSTLTMLLCILWALHLRGKWYEFAGLGGLFAFGCMLRINNILFVPVLAFIVLNGIAGFWRDWRRTLLPGAAGFLLVFMPQFAVNWYFYGNPLQFSYTRYAAGAHTYFSVEFFRVNIAFHVASNYFLVILGMLGVCCQKNWRLRTIFVLWFMPVMVFFWGYSHGCDDALRFIMTGFPALLLAFCCSDLWSGRDRFGRWAALIMLFCLVIWPPNATAHWTVWPDVVSGVRQNWPGLLIGLALALAGWRYFKIYRGTKVAALATTALLYYAGDAFVLATLLCLVAIWALSTPFFACRQKIFARRMD